jgi:hypothetical protein
MTTPALHFAWIRVTKWNRPVRITAPRLPDSELFRTILNTYRNLHLIESEQNPYKHLVSTFRLSSLAWWYGVLS